MGVAIDGLTAIVGSKGDDGSGTNAGAVFAYQWDARPTARPVSVILPEDSSATRRFVVKDDDGDTFAFTVADMPLHGIAAAAGDGRLTIGASAQPEVEEHFRGTLDEVRIYAAALTAEEIAGGQVTEYEYDHRGRLVEVTDRPAAVGHPHLWGPEVGQLLADDRGGGVVLCVMGDPEGSVRNVIQTSGAWFLVEGACRRG